MGVPRIAAPIVVLLIQTCLPSSSGFGIESASSLLHQHASFLSLDTSSLHASADISVAAGSSLLSQYTHLLKAFPLPTKMLTGASLATAGDAIAQSRDADTPYSKKRSLSFAVFDAAYRCLQHAAFPIIIATCHGQYLASILPTSSVDVSYLAAMEQTLASQLIIVPFIYYPVFFTLTGVIQNLSPEAAWDRARDNFLPLMKRNLLFWIPMQFIQFEYVPIDLQIPFLSVCGLAWTCILSLAAGSTAKYSGSNTELSQDDTLSNDHDLLQHLPEQAMITLSDHLHAQSVQGELDELTASILSEQVPIDRQGQVAELAR